MNRIILTSPAVAAKLAAQSPEAQRELVTSNISLAFVNSHISAGEAAEAHDALVAHWQEIEQATAHLTPPSPAGIAVEAQEQA